jgi:nucleoside-diphosphate-sugar epimerase
MVVVAIVAPTSNIGSHMLQALQNTQHQVVTISRSPQPELSAKGSPNHVATYLPDAHAALVSFLKDHKVHTIISGIWSLTGFVQSHFAILAAAKEAGVRRFAPSEWAVPVYETIGLYGMKLEVWEECLKSGLEVTRFHCGLWTNGFGYGATKEPEEALAGYTGPTLGIQMDKGTATLVKDGNDEVVFSRLQDIVPLVVKTLDLPKWEHDTFIVGDRTTYKRILDVAQKVTGRTFEVKYLTEQDIHQGLHSSELVEKLISQFNTALTNGELNFGQGQELNKRFPEVKMMSVEEFIERHFGK